MAAAAPQLEALAASVGDRAGAAILEFQIALLDDEDLIAPIFERIAKGERADGAWRAGMDAEIAVYRTSGDEVLEARTSDLADLRDRVLDALSPRPPPAAAVDGEQAIYVAEELTPSRFLETDWSRYRGAAIKGAAPRGHVALLARARGTPLLIGLGDDFRAAARRRARAARCRARPPRPRSEPRHARRRERRLAEQAASAAVHARFLDRPAVTADGEPVEVLINVDDPALLAAVDPSHTDGIGLTRTEFLFRGPDLPDEARQYRAYRRDPELGGGPPGDHPDPGCRRRQADRRPDARGRKQPVPRACAACACRSPGRTCSRSSCARSRAPQSAGTSRSWRRWSPHRRSSRPSASCSRRPSTGDRCAARRRRCRRSA